MTRKLLPAVLIAVTSISAGCGSTAATGGSTLSAQEKGVKFSACMRTHGVADFPDPDAQGEFQYGVSVRGTVWRKAVDACEDLQPPGSLSAKRTPKAQSAALKVAACIRANGVTDFPDPVNGEPLIDTTKIPSSNRPGGMDILNAAIAKCTDVMRDAIGGRQ